MQIDWLFITVGVLIVLCFWGWGYMAGLREGKNTMPTLNAAHLPNGADHEHSGGATLQMICTCPSCTSGLLELFNPRPHERP